MSKFTRASLGAAGFALCSSAIAELVGLSPVWMRCPGSFVTAALPGAFSWILLCVAEFGFSAGEGFCGCVGGVFLLWVWSLHRGWFAFLGMEGVLGAGVLGVGLGSVAAGLGWLMIRRCQPAGATIAPEGRAGAWLGKMLLLFALQWLGVWGLGGDMNIFAQLPAYLLAPFVIGFAACRYMRLGLAVSLAAFLPVPVLRIGALLRRGVDLPGVMDFTGSPGIRHSIHVSGAAFAVLRSWEMLWVLGLAALGWWAARLLARCVAARGAVIDAYGSARAEG